MVHILLKEVSHMYYVGVDYHLEVAVACIMGPLGEGRREDLSACDHEGNGHAHQEDDGHEVHVLLENSTKTFDTYWVRGWRGARTDYPRAEFQAAGVMQLPQVGDVHENILLSGCVPVPDAVQAGHAQAWGQGQEVDRGQVLASERQRKWEFCTEESILYRPMDVKKRRHVKVRNSANPYTDRAYFLER